MEREGRADAKLSGGVFQTRLPDANGVNSLGVAVSRYHWRVITCAKAGSTLKGCQDVGVPRILLAGVALRVIFRSRDACLLLDFFHHHVAGLALDSV